MAQQSTPAAPQDALSDSAEKSDRDAFTWQLPTGALKRPRTPEKEEPFLPRQRRASTSIVKSYVEDSSDEGDSGDNYRGTKSAGSSRQSRRPRHRKSDGDATGRVSLSIRVPSSSTPNTEPSHLPTPRHSVPVSRSFSSSSTPSLPTWLPEFSAADKAAALKWVVTRQRPTDLVENIQSWLEFADNVRTWIQLDAQRYTTFTILTLYYQQHPEHTPPEWLCYYLVHHPTFDAVESGLGSPVI